MNMCTHGERIYSYNTCIRDVTPDGRSIGNVTKYSVTTSKHQTKAGSRLCDVLVDNVPRGTQDLFTFYQKGQTNGG